MVDYSKWKDIEVNMRGCAVIFVKFVIKRN